MAGRIEVAQVEREKEWRISIGCYSTGLPSPGKGREMAQVARTKRHATAAATADTTVVGAVGEGRGGLHCLGAA